MAGRLSVGGLVGPMLGYPGPPINQVWPPNSTPVDQIELMANRCKNVQNGQNASSLGDAWTAEIRLRSPQKLIWPLESNDTPGGRVTLNSSLTKHTIWLQQKSPSPPHVCLTFSQISERRTKKSGSQRKTNIWDVSDPTGEWKNFGALESFWMLRSRSNFTAGCEELRLGGLPIRKLPEILISRHLFLHSHSRTPWFQDRMLWQKSSSLLVPKPILSSQAQYSSFHQVPQNLVNFSSKVLCRKLSFDAIQIRKLLELHSYI